MTDCMRKGLSFRSRAIAGSAVLTMVPSSVCMKKPTATSHSRMRSERSSAGAGAEGFWFTKGFLQS